MKVKTKVKKPAVRISLQKPSIEALKKITSDLSKKSGDYVSLEIRVTNNVSLNTEDDVGFWFYSKILGVGDHFQNWKDVISEYRLHMRRK